MSASAARKWFRPAAPVLGPLAVVALVEVLLFAGYHAERWRKTLLPRKQPSLRVGEGLVIRCDGHGYYAWLRSLLIDGDCSFDNEFDEHNPLGDWVPASSFRTEKGLRSNHWSVGPACVWALTVVPGHGFLRLLQHLGCELTTEGYELPYQLLVGLTTVLAGLLGLFCLYTICRQYARPARAALAAAFLTLGTTIVFYSAIEVSMAHGLGTAVVAGLAAYWGKTYGVMRPGRWLRVGLLLGLACLMRWQLATFAVLPAGEAVLAWRKGLRPGKVLGVLTLAGAGTFLGVLPQLLAWKAVYGHWLVAPLSTGHNWLAPSWGRVLFSSDRGLFYWTPLALVALPGFARYRPPSGRGPTESPRGGGEVLALLLIAFVLQVYVLASIWGEAIQLGVSFGFRHLTESVVILGPGLALLLERAGPRQFACLCALGCGLVLWNLLLICQYRYGLLPADGGADPAGLLAGIPRLVLRKKGLLATQIFIGPVLLWVLRPRSGPLEGFSQRGTGAEIPRTTDFSAGP